MTPTDRTDRGDDPTADALAARLAEHARWLESGGREGVRLDLHGQDLSGLDLRDADLRHADLRGCRLEGTDLREARLNFADLTEVSHLLAAQLAGADVAGAKLPPEIHVFERLEHIEDVTKGGRKVFLFMLLAVGYTWLTIATTTDVQLLTNAATSPLPIILTALPLAGFYWTAPLVLLGFYLYLQLSLQALWEGLASMPAVFPDGRKVDDKAHPWLLTGLVTAHLKRLRGARPAMARVQNALSIALAWYAVPLTMAAVWLRYLPRRDPLASGFHVLVVVLTAVAGIAFYRLAVATLCGRPRTRWWRRAQRGTLAGVEVVILSLVVVLMPLLSYGSIAGGTAHAALDPRAWVPELFAALGYSPFADFEDRDVSRRPELWSERDSALDMVRGANLQGTDLYRAAAAGAFLVKADLRAAGLEAADLELADLRQARLAGAVLRRANLLQADLREADLDRAELGSAALVLARLQGATLRRADLRGAFLTRADLRDADLHRANLGDAHLGDADLRGANLELAILTGANLQGADLRDVVGLDCFQLASALTDAETRLPENPACSDPNQ